MSKKKKNAEQSYYSRWRRFMDGTLDPADIHEPKRSRLQELEKQKIEDREIFVDDLIKGKEEKIHDDYEKWSRSHGVKLMKRIYSILSIIVCIGIIAILLITVERLPRFGNKANPDNNEVSTRYIEKGIEETGAVNIVAGMILDYRAFDTYGESNVLFIACCCVMILLRNDNPVDKKQEDEDTADEHYERDSIVMAGARILVPVIILYGICNILNGHLSPGGGFSGGAIIGAGLILYANAFGMDRMEKLFSYRTFRKVTFMALLFYGLAKSYSFFTGANHLKSGIPLGTPGNILSSGLILPLNICVGLVVACTMYGFYALFKRGRI